MSKQTQSKGADAASLPSRRPLSSALLLALLACLVLTNAPTFAQGGVEEPEPKLRKGLGRIQVSTTPEGYPIFIDGNEAGKTTTFVRRFDLPEGPHTVRILFPPDANGRENTWSHTFNLVSGRRECVNLNYRPRTISIPRATVSPCPYPVNVSAPATVNDGDIITFTAGVDYEGPSALNYTWTVSPPSARIVSGAGTPTITVDSTGLGRRRITAILVVDDGSGDRNCRQTSQASTSVLAATVTPIKPQRFDEFPSVSFDDDKARLDNFAIELQNNPGARGYIIAYAGTNTRPGTADGLGERARRYMVATRGLDASRIVVLNGGYRERNSYELWLVPIGAEPPQPSPTAQPGEYRPSRRRGR
ncbi:MAG TPA: PEGA domain-containing protein [Pyrinomonadaceae bacterium]